MTDTATDFLAKIRSLTTPEEQRAVRGIYADWLDDQDKPLDASRQRVLAEPASDDRREQFAAQLDLSGQGNWAEFVRLQCKIARGFRCEREKYLDIYTDVYGGLPVERVFRGNCGYCDNCINNEDDVMLSKAILMGNDTLMRDSIKSYDPNWYEWRHPAPAGYCINRLSYGYSPFLPSGPNMGVLFSRGLISEVVSPWEGQYGWQEWGDKITDAHPVEKVTLTTMPKWVADPQSKYRCWEYHLKGCRNWIKVSDNEMHSSTGYRFVEEIVRKLLRMEWPGIAFTLPGSAS